MCIRDRHGSSLYRAEGCTQCSMTIHERLKRESQRRHIRFHLYLDSGSDVVSHAFRCELLEKPESLLSIREREGIGLLDKSGLSSRRRLDQLETTRRNLRDAL